jgi:hypothetical protein
MAWRRKQKGQEEQKKAKRAFCLFALLALFASLIVSRLPKAHERLTGETS